MRGLYRHHLRYIKISLLIVFLPILLSKNVQSCRAQQIDWVKTVEGTFPDAAFAVKVISSNNVMIGGGFAGTIDFFGQTHFAQNKSIFLAQFQSNSSPLWMKVFNCSGTSVVRAIEEDNRKNIIIAGDFSGTLNLGGIILSGSNDAFIASLAPDGTVRWAYNAGGAGFDYGQDLLVFEEHIYFTGYFAQELNIQGHSYYSPGTSDMFLMKFDTLGDLKWVRYSIGLGLCNGLTLTNDRYNVFVGGMFSGRKIINQDTLSTFGSNFQDAYIASFDKSGNNVWMKQLGSPSGTERVEALATNSLNELYAAGTFDGILTVDGHVLGGNDDVFVVKFDENKQVQWVKAVTGAGTERIYAMGCDIANEVYICGSYSGTLTIGDSSKFSAGLADIYVARLGTNGSTQRLISAGGFLNDDAYDMHISPYGEVYFTGYFGGNAQFGPYSVNTLYPNDFDIYLAKIHGSAITSVPPDDPSVISLSVFPNPTQSSVLLKSNDTYDSYMIIDQLGRLVYAQTGMMNSPLDVTHLNNGIYSIRVDFGSRTEYVRFIISK